MKSSNNLKCGLSVAIALTAGLGFSATAADWSTTEAQFQYGNLVKAFQGGNSGAETDGTSVITLQHASGWKYGDNFFFVDYLDYGKTDVEQVIGQATGTELYGEWYSNFSLSKMTGNDVSLGFIKDVGIIAGFNFAPEVNTHYYLPGVRLALDLPGFAFANLDITAYIPDSSKTVPGVNGLTFDEDDSFMIDFNWALPFKLGSTSWSLEGHVEYIEGADMQGNDNGFLFDAERESWILAQPQLRMDLGEVMFGNAGQLFVGVEWQYWKNKLGDKDTDENVVQALAVWRF